ncbi:hypothetical protein DNTS_025234 [Danionella cerebrum]|uniref:glucuronosyltransferase n=1 Tax=Danionella cerebrum TaxID=2873325 RepID=A0A553QSF5_9TELE|nr:hypothetical protein DNTS_025234 [Danionella translucida]
MSATVFLFALLCLNLTPCVSGGKILVWPSEFSHWLNVKVILDKLIERGNDVTVVTHSATPSVNISPASGYNVEVLQVPHTKQDIKDNLEAMLKYWTHEMTTDTILQASQKLKELSDTATNHNLATCRELFSRVDLLEKWKKEKFDAVLADPGFMCGELLAQKLGLPLILSLRYSFGHTLERLCGQIPAPPSYVPAIGSEKTDKMDFMQRLRNIIFYGAQDILFYLGPTFYWDPFYSKVMELVPRVSSMRCLVEPRALLLLFISVNVRFSRGGNVLVLPGEYSHWHNMRNILDELLNRNHTVTVLLSSSSPSINITQHERYEFLVFETPLKPNEMHSLSEQLINIWMQHPKPSRIRVALQILDLMGKLRDMHSTLCDAMLRNEELISRLSARKFHLLFYDPMFICSDLLAEMLGLPLVLSLRFSLGFSMERMCGQMPSPVSYVPVPPTVLTDHMSFPERVQNMISYLLYTSMFRLAAMSLDNYYTDVLGKPTTMCETMGKADIWLIRTYWDFEYPRPFLPNFKFVGGLHCKPAKPLPKELEAFVQSSGDHGIIVFSLGSMINNLTMERANTIASALGQIPQKVVWRYSGKTPETLAANTKLQDWMPQNDLLGHPKTKAFITHGGTNGLYEAIYHGVPMVGLPLFADQPDNLMHMKTKGAAVSLDINTMESKDLPMKPLDQAVYWIEFVMRNKGAKHLRVQAHELSWYQYHCLDVLAFLLSITALITYLCVKTSAFLFRKCFRKTRPDAKGQKNKEE